MRQRRTTTQRPLAFRDSPRAARRCRQLQSVDDEPAATCGRRPNRTSDGYHHDLRRPRHPDHEPVAAARHTRRGTRRTHSGRRLAGRTRRLGTVRTRHPFPRQGADARAGRGSQPRHRGRTLALRLRRLPRPHGPRRSGLARRAIDRSGRRAPARGAGRSRRPRATAGGLGLRPDLLRRAALHAAGPGPGVDHSPGRLEPCQPAHHQREQCGPRARRLVARRTRPPRTAAGQRRDADR